MPNTNEKKVRTVYALREKLQGDGLNNRFMRNGGIIKRFKVIKDGEEVFGCDGVEGYFYDKGCYVLTNETGRWQVLYEDEFGKRVVMKSFQKENEACTFFYELISGGKEECAPEPYPMPRPYRTPKQRSDKVFLEGDAEDQYYWKDGVLYSSSRGKSCAEKRFDSPNKAERYLKKLHKK